MRITPVWAELVVSKFPSGLGGRCSLIPSNMFGQVKRGHHRVGDVPTLQVIAYAHFPRLAITICAEMITNSVLVIMLAVGIFGRTA